MTLLKLTDAERAELARLKKLEAQEKAALIAAMDEHERNDMWESLIDEMRDMRPYEHAEECVDAMATLDLLEYVQELREEG